MDSGRHFRVIDGGAARKVPGGDTTGGGRRFVPVELPPEEPFFDRTMLGGLLLALVVGIPLGIVALAEAVLDDEEDGLAVVEVELVETPEPTLEPTPEPEPEPEEPEVVEMDKPIALPKDVPADEPPEDVKPTFGVVMENTVEANSTGASVRVGNNLMQQPDEFVPPEDVKPLREVSFAKLEEPPVLVRDFRAEYPPGPKADGVEGTVLMKLTIDDSGDVTEVRVVRGVHPELDAAAKAAAFRFSFKPGKSGGKAVITKGYVYRYTWIITE